MRHLVAKWKIDFFCLFQQLSCLVLCVQTQEVEGVEPRNQSTCPLIPYRSLREHANKTHAQESGFVRDHEKREKYFNGFVRFDIGFGSRYFMFWLHIYLLGFFFGPLLRSPKQQLLEQVRRVAIYEGKKLAQKISCQIANKISWPFDMCRVRAGEHGNCIRLNCSFQLLTLFAFWSPAVWQQILHNAPNCALALARLIKNEKRLRNQLSFEHAFGWNLHWCLFGMAENFLHLVCGCLALCWSCDLVAVLAQCM